MDRLPAEIGSEAVLSLWGHASLVALQRRSDAWLRRAHSIASGSAARELQLDVTAQQQHAFFSLYRTTRTLAVSGDTPFTPAPHLRSTDLAKAQTLDQRMWRTSLPNRGAPDVLKAAVSAARDSGRKPRRMMEAVPEADAAAELLVPSSAAAETPVSTSQDQQAEPESSAVPEAAGDTTTASAQPRAKQDQPGAHSVPADSNLAPAPRPRSAEGQLRSKSATASGRASPLLLDLPPRSSTPPASSAPGNRSTTDSRGGLLSESSPLAARRWTVNEMLTYINDTLSPGDQCLLAAALQHPRQSGGLPLRPGTDQLYAAIVSHRAEQCAILGVAVTGPGRPALEIVVPITRGLQVSVTGDGDFLLLTQDRDKPTMCFKPASVLSLWTFVATMNSLLERAEPYDDTWGWLQAYEAQSGDTAAANSLLWQRIMEDKGGGRRKSAIFGTQTQSTTTEEAKDEDVESFKQSLVPHIKAIIARSDLDDVTSKQVRIELEKTLNMPLKRYKAFIDETLLVVLGQSTPPSKILDNLFLGTEYNACNREELRRLNVSHVLNCTSEVPCFFERDSTLKYYRIAVLDEPEAPLRGYWETSFKFIDEARKQGHAVLVHCKMGVSRSASTVIAYLMKSQRLSLEQAFALAKERRDVVQPNNGFWEELQVYEGLLRASQNKTALFDQDPRDRLRRAHNIAEMLELIAGGYRIYSFQLERQFQSVENLKQASPAQLREAGLPPSVAANIYEFLRD